MAGEQGFLRQQECSALFKVAWLRGKGGSGSPLPLGCSTPQLWSRRALDLAERLQWEVDDLVLARFLLSAQKP